MKDQPLIAIVGPTAVGKSELALKLAEEFHGEIVSADSRQIYRGMDIGTAKPSPADRARVPHHLIDLVDPSAVFTLADYQYLAYAVIAQIHARRKVPLLVGGTGLYVRAVLDGLTIPRVLPDPERRRELEREDAHTLHARLQQLDPRAAAKIDPRNKRRVIRALEVCQAIGQPISELQKTHPPHYRLLRLGLTMPRAQLYERINARVDRMIEAGLIEEVRALLARGYAPDLPAMSGLGYRHIAAYLNGTLTREEAIRQLKRDTRRFVHHQYTWFRLDDPRIRWYNLEVSREDEIRATVVEFLGESAK